MIITGIRALAQLQVPCARATCRQTHFAGWFRRHNVSPGSPVGIIVAAMASISPFIMAYRWPLVGLPCITRCLIHLEKTMFILVLVARQMPRRALSDRLPRPIDYDGCPGNHAHRSPNGVVSFFYLTAIDIYCCVDGGSTVGTAVSAAATPISLCPNIGR